MHFQLSGLPEFTNTNVRLTLLNGVVLLTNAACLMCVVLAGPTRKTELTRLVYRVHHHLATHHLLTVAFSLIIHSLSFSRWLFFC